MVERATGIPASDQIFTVTRDGRPMCAGGPDISISHSGNWVACATAFEGSLGVDLQFPRSRLSIKEIAAWCLSDEETEWLQADPAERFFMLWTLKEAYIKAIGTNLFDGLDCLSCTIEPPLIKVRFKREPAAALDLYRFGKGYLSLAYVPASTAELEIAIRTISVRDRPAVRFLAATQR